MYQIILPLTLPWKLSSWTCSFGYLTLQIKLGSPGYKERYYKAKFSVETAADIEGKMKEIVCVSTCCLFGFGKLLLFYLK